MNALMRQTFEFADMPVQAVPHMRIAGGWDLTLGAKNQKAITLDDYRRAFEGVGIIAPICTDLEPVDSDPTCLLLDPAALPLSTIQAEVQRGLDIGAAMQALRPASKRMIYGLWHRRDYWIRNNVARHREHVRLLQGMGAPGSLANRVTHVCFDYYRFSDDEAFDYGLEANIDEARTWGLPVCVVVSPWRMGMPVEELLPPAMLEADVRRISRKLSIARGDEIAWWGPRTNPGKSADGRDIQVPRAWDPAWPWVQVYKNVCGVS